MYGTLIQKEIAYKKFNRFALLYKKILVKLRYQDKYSTYKNILSFVISYT